MSVQHEYDAEIAAKIKTLVHFGATQEQIANHLDIDAKTLRKHYREELDKSELEMLAAVASTAVQRALRGDVKMIDMVLRCRGRWTNYKAPEDDKKSNMETLLEKLVDKL